MKLAGKIAVITGGSSGIGRETAELFAREGATVVVASGSDIAEAQAVADGIIAAGGGPSRYRWMSARPPRSPRSRRSWGRSISW